MICLNYIERCSECKYMYEDSYGQWACAKRNLRCKFVGVCFNCDDCTWCFETNEGEAACSLTLDDKGFTLCEYMENCPLDEIDLEET